LQFYSPENEACENFAEREVKRSECMDRHRLTLGLMACACHIPTSVLYSALNFITGTGSTCSRNNCARGSPYYFEGFIFPTRSAINGDGPFAGRCNIILAGKPVNFGLFATFKFGEWTDPVLIDMTLVELERCHIVQFYSRTPWCLLFNPALRCTSVDFLCLTT
jgi:hypothetical protein